MNDIIAPTLTSPSSRLIEFLLSLTIDELPAIVVAEARMRLLDSLGCGLYGATTAWGEIAARVAYGEGSQGYATIYGHSQPLAPARAALVNGTATHGFELDDGAPGHAHPGSMVVPAALATAEQYQCSGAKLLLGVIAGYEAVSRVGFGIGEAGVAFHSPSIAGAVGAAVASGVTLGMTHEQIMRAVGISCSFAGGIKSFIQGTGGMVKRMHAGRASESGVLACLLAQRGFTAPLAALEGKLGLLEVFGGDNFNPHALDSKLGEHYIVNQAQTKVYPFCYGMHTMAQALHGLRREYDIDHSAIKSVRVGTNKLNVSIHAEVAPKETMAAQYSMPFTAALALVGDPKDPRAFAGGALNDRAVCDLAPRVELYADPEMEAIFPRHGAHVEVHLTDGRALRAKALHAKGTAGNPCTHDEITDKFRVLASVSQTDDSVAAILSLVEQIETLPSMQPLSKALRGGIREQRQSSDSE